MGGLSKLVLILLVSVLPAIEVRGAIPLAYALMEGPEGRVLGVAVAVLGNLLVAPILLKTLRYLESLIMDPPIKSLRKASKIYVAYVGRLRRRVGKWVDRYGAVGLAIFVAIPLPGSGAWTGSIAAHILGIKFEKALVAVELGVLGASALVLLASEGIFSLLPT